MADDPDRRQDRYITADGVPAAGGTIAPRRPDVRCRRRVRRPGLQLQHGRERRSTRRSMRSWPRSRSIRRPSAHCRRWTRRSRRRGTATRSSTSGGWTVRQRPRTGRASTTTRHPQPTRSHQPGRTRRISVASQALVPRPSDEFLVSFHASTTGERSTRLRRRGSRHMGIDPDRLGNGSLVRAVQCRGGDRRHRWPGVRLHWSNSTFDRRQHLNLVSWLKLLETVTFDPGAAVDR